MKHKLVTKILSVTLALCLLLGCCMTAFASDATYKATYNGVATKEVYKTLLADANEEIGKQALNGNTIQEMYKFLPQLAGLFKSGEFDALKSADYYVKAEPKIFAGLKDYMAETSATDVTPEVLTGYFAKHPVEIKNVKEFQEKLNNFIDNLMTPKHAYTLISLFGFAIADPDAFAQAFDEICLSLNIKQEKPFWEPNYQGIFWGTLMGGGTASGEPFAKYVNNIINALLPDLTNNVMQILKTLSVPENGAHFYHGLSVVINNLTAIKGFVPQIGQFIEIFNALPTVGEGDAKMLDLEGSIEYLVNDVIAGSMAKPAQAQVYAVQAYTDTRGKKILSFSGDGMINFDHMNLANLREAADTTDVFNVVFHYLHHNLNKTENKTLLKTAVGLLPSLGVNVPKVIVDYLTFVLNNNESESVYQLYKLLRTSTGHELKFKLDVQNGKGSGEYVMGKTVAIEADKAPEGKVFDRWVSTGVKVQIKDATAEKTTIVMADRNVAVKATYKAAAAAEPTKEFVGGANASWQQKSNSDMVFTVSGNLQDFKGLTIDGKTVDKANYTVKEVNGNLQITVKSDFMNKLAQGDHQIAAQYKDGTQATTSIKVTAPQKGGANANADIPKTGFLTSSLDSALAKTGIAAAVLVSALGTVAIVKKRKF